MQAIAEQEYQVLITHTITEESKPSWWATLLGFPFVVEEAFSREQVIAKIRKRIADMVAQSEIITLSAPALSAEANGISENKIDAQLLANGWDDFGQLKGDESALAMYDEIEQERERHIIGSK